MPLPDRILFYDGDCGLCDRLVQRILDRERDQRIHFATLQGELAGRTLPELGITPGDLSSAVLLVDGGTDRARAYTKAAAVLRLAPHLRFPMSLLSWARIVPLGLSNRVYDAVAKRRHRWFERPTTCRLMKPHMRGRFLDLQTTPNGVNIPDR